MTNRDKHIFNNFTQVVNHFLTASLKCYSLLLLYNFAAEK